MLTRSVGLRGGGAGSAAPALVEAGLLAHWKFADGTGQVVADETGSYPLTLGSTGSADTNDPAWAGEGLSFITDDYARPPSVFDTSSGEVFMDLVVRFDATVDNDMPYSDLHAIPRKGFEIARETGIIKCFCYGTDGSTNVLEAGAVVEGQWERLSFGGDATGMGFYRGGVLAEEALAPFQINNEAEIPGFGCRTYNFTFFFTGVIGYCLLYNRVLSQSERDQNGEFLKSEMAKRGVIL